MLLSDIRLSVWSPVCHVHQA